ncbi:hypothetical protein MD484_g1546, partial [Candolleomyces efflorescens]
MPTTGDDLPPEIWLAIADEVIASEIYSRDRLRSRYMAVNRVFYNLYLDTVYGDVQWTKLDKDMMKQLTRLQEPVIASHVRSLRIHAWFIDHLMKRDAQTMPPSPLPGRMLSFFTYNAKAHPANQAQNKLIADISSKDIMDLMMSAIDNMKNVREYHFELRDLKFTKESSRFLVAARQAFSSSLRKLSVHTTIFKFESVLALSDFEHLEDLELHFDYQWNRVHDEDAHKASKFAESQVLKDTIVPFINRRKDTLQSLTIASYSMVDLSDFFGSLGPFKSLRRLSANICLDSKQLSDSKAFIDFIHNHRDSLLELDIRPRPPEEEFVNADETARRRKESWVRIQNALLSTPEVASSLEGLHLSVGDLDACLALVGRSSHSLTHLSLIDTFLRLKDLTRVLNLFSRDPLRLKSLFVWVHDLTVPLLVLLIGKLPGLHSLVLLFEICSDSADPVYLRQDRFLRGLQDASAKGHLNWQVEHISVVQVKGSIGQEDAELLGVPSTGVSTDQAYMHAISSTLPSVKSHKGIHWHRQLPPIRIHSTPPRPYTR